MKRFKHYAIIFLLFQSVCFSAFSQSKSKTAKPEQTKEDYDVNTAEKCILIELNKLRLKGNMDTLVYHDILYRAAGKKAQSMSNANKAELKTKAETQSRAIAAGATNKVDEIILAINVVSGKKDIKPEKLAVDVIQKWKNNKKVMEVVNNPIYLFASPSIKINEKGNKAFISVVFGSNYSFNTGHKKIKEIEVPYTTKNKKIKPADARACNNCKKFNDYEGLSTGVYVDKGIIYLRYDNLKGLLKLIRKPTDGIAIDIIQKKQYQNLHYNVLDNNLLTKGIQLKPVTKSKLLSQNKIKPEKKGKRVLPVTKLDVPLGKIPPKLKGEFELNLLIIQDGKLCKTVYRSYIEQGNTETNQPLRMLLMPEDHAYTKPLFEPQSESTLLSFLVPFEKNKSDYKPTDIQPFLDALDEPDFFIEGVYITAYSSIEGNAAVNAQLQKKRAESIVKALSNLQQKKQLLTNIKTSDSWNLFQLELEDTEFDYLTKMDKEKAIQEINTKAGLVEKLEPYLAKERFAQIILDVTYDIAGPKEEKFSVSKFNQAVKKGDTYTAYKIQYFIGKQMLEKKYSNYVLQKTNIPYEAKFSGLLNNQIVLNSYASANAVNWEDLLKFDSISKIDPANAYIAFNKAYCRVKLDTLVNEGKTPPEVQAEIDALYKLNLPKKYLDELNVEWQFRIIAANDTAKNGEKIVANCINRIKSFYNINDAGWQNNLKLSYIFARFGDYKFATNLLLPFIYDEEPNEDLLFAFISFSAKAPELYNSRNFAIALEKASKINNERFCKIFGQAYLTTQVFDNPSAKSVYHQSKCKK